MNMEIQSARGKEIKNNIKTVLRWVFVLPVFILVYFAFKAFTDIGTASFLPGDFVKKVVYSPDLSGAYYLVFGSLYLFTRELGSFAIALFLAVRIAPKHNKSVFFSLIGLWVLMILISVYSMGRLNAKGYYWSTWMVWKLVIESAAQISAFLAVGVELFRANDQLEQTG